MRQTEQVLKHLKITGSISNRLKQVKPPEERKK